MSDLASQGHLLRRTLKARLRIAIGSRDIERKLKCSATDVAEVVRRYVPEDTAFDDAGNILRSAGFELDGRPTAESPKIC